MRILKNNWFKIQFLIIVLPAIWYWGRCSDYSKKSLRTTIKISDNLYNQIFYISPLDHEFYAYYLTDSLKFRKFIGAVNENTDFEFVIKNKKITIEKWSRDVQYDFDIHVPYPKAWNFADAIYEHKGEPGFGRYYKIETKVYHLDYLKQEGAWD